ncbi:M81 family metallopeptidase [Streptomyces somaliensis DSM 40738]|uniref:M81 family metallopeptidase n=1 Tax=Streptomyces somaliensis (strain ATCC 33201 / DSM 40738 / JCM 12659 / KCTC 9044 / NCTC 11332 / NRRL B-12077 / IP 733) TaxID=1134445 RepID=A0AA44IBZ9_STRE0|nr:M81 family metallopeptidase [Streptomyces somaliensis]MCQ0025071.1 M81 family metallopeptidase [Streptomyces somaliensis DSM 40738]NKY13150.1 M81 family metallopeptidase [Streptomyces somaliensis DSM 40738]
MNAGDTGALRVAVAGLVHESSTFMVEYLGTATASAFSCHAGNDLLREFTGTATVVGGYLRACSTAGVAVRPAFHARAEPGAAMGEDAYRVLEGRFASELRGAGQCDVVLLDLHGAGVIAPDRSLDVAVLRAVRRLLPEAVVAVTMDLHANVPSELLGLADVVCGYHLYPHTDCAERARLAADLAFSTARGTVRPTAHRRRLAMLLPPSPTTRGAPARELMETVKEVESRPGILACTVFHGFPYADTDQAATSVVTVADGDPALAESCGDEVARWLEAHRERFRSVLTDPREAVRRALAADATTVVIGDGSDNPGCGATGDSTHLLRALLDVPEPTCLATLWDPESVAAAVAAGVGATARFRLGGRHGWASGPPVEAVGTVRALTDGRTVQTAMRRGKTTEFGRCARITVGNTEVIVASERRQVLDPEIIRLHGVVPERCRIIGVKSVNHFRAGFADLADLLLVADAPGPTARAIEDIPRQGPTRDLWPMSARSAAGGDEPRPE